jgi:hypothetical protein
MSIPDCTVLQRHVPKERNSEKLLLMNIIIFVYAAHTALKFNISYMIVSHFHVYLYFDLELFSDNLAEFQIF